MAVVVAPTSTHTLGDLKTRIADEIARADLTDQIALAIDDAIAEASTHRFWFMELSDIALTLTAGVSVYASSDVASLIEIDRFVLVANGQRRTLRQMNADELARLNDGTPPQGEPYAWSRYASGIVVYPVPTQTYSVLIDGVTNGGVIDGDEVGNIWTDRSLGERYVRSLAKRDLYGHVMGNTDKALAMDQFAQRYRAELLEQTHARTATNEMCVNA